jgi:hypothetical protein
MVAEKPRSREKKKTTAAWTHKGVLTSPGD